MRPPTREQHPIAGPAIGDAEPGSGPHRGLRWAALGVAALGVLALAAVGVAAGLTVRARRTPPPAPGAGGGTAGASARAAAGHFLDTYLGPDGRVVRHDQGGDSVSEGQAYAMLVAVAVGDRPRFDRAWGWARANLRRADGLSSWHWAGGAVQDPQASSDADLDAARALLLAADRFGVASYREEALRMGQAILDHETVTLGGRRILVAGPWAQTAPVYGDPSYLSPRTFDLLRAASGNGAWAQLAASGYGVVAGTSAGPGLPPDWVRFDGQGTAVASAPPGGSGPPVYGFDATRTLVRLAEDCNPRGRALAAAAWPFLKTASAGSIAAVYTLEGRPQVPYTAPVAEVAAAAAAHAGGDATAALALLDRAEAADKASGTYYGAAWVALGRIMLTTTWLGTCAG